MSLLRLKKEQTKISQPIEEEVSQGTAASMEKVSRLILYFLVFTLPLFFWPGFPEVLDFPKQILLTALALVALFLWLLDELSKERTGIRFNFIYIPVVALLVFWGASTLFSFSRYGSFWGWPLRINESFLTLLAFAVLVFLIHQLIRERKEIVLFLLLLVASGLLASLFGFLQIWGKFLLPFDFAKNTLFNTVGSPSALAVFVAGLLPLTVGMTSVVGSWWRGFFLSAGLLMFITLVAVNAWFAWVTLLVGSVVYLGLMALKVKGGPTRGIGGLRSLLPPMFLVAASLFFLLVREPLPGFPAARPEVYPTHRTTLEINLQALKERPILGTGPGTFVINYSKFKKPIVNQTIFWNIRFSSGASKLTDSFGTGGILGGGAYLLLLGFVFYLIWQKISRKEALRFLDVAMTAGLVGIVTGQIISPSGLILDFVFWVILGLLLATTLPDDRFSKAIIRLFGNKISKEDLPVTSQIAISSNNIVSMLISFAIVVLLASGIAFFYFGAKRTAAEMSYLQGLQAFNRGDLQGSFDRIAKAASLNNRHDIYFRDLAQVYLALARQESLRQDIIQEQVQQNVFNLAVLAVNMARRATDLEPKNVANWSARGFIYQNLIGVVGGADEAALTLGYERALDLEPANPYLLTEIGRVYLQRAVLAQQREDAEGARNELSKAEEWFNKAIALKPDYAPAHFQLAVAAEIKGDRAQLITKLQETKMLVNNVNDFVELSFQLGVLYYQARDYAKAKAELEAAVLYNENYSNARYFLGLIYDAEGRRVEAIGQFERIAELNPDNELVKKILANLRAGQPALSGVTEERPPQPPPFLEGQPEEIRE